MENPAVSTCPTVDLAVAAALPVPSQRKPPEPMKGFREIFESEETGLLRYAFGLVGQRETAEDLVQEAFLKLHAHWDDVENHKAWLYRAVRNLAFNHLRDHRKEAPLENEGDLASQQPDPGHAMGRMEAVGTLRMLMAELRDDDRRLLGLKYHDGLKYDQISERTGLSVGNVGYKLHHVLKNLGEAMKRLGVEGIDG